LAEPSCHNMLFFSLWNGSSRYCGTFFNFEVFVHIIEFTALCNAAWRLQRNNIKLLYHQFNKTYKELPQDNIMKLILYYVVLSINNCYLFFEHP
jgi:hypothetical protein